MKGKTPVNVGASVRARLLRISTSGAVGAPMVDQWTASNP
jgi:hypothetical protein